MDKGIRLVSSSGNAVAATGKETVGDSIKRTITENFGRLFREAPEPSLASPNGKMPACGPYGKPIWYLANSRVTHTAGEHIPQLRALRAFTQNAVELACPALGLAVYVSTMVQISQAGSSGRTGFKTVRVVIYDFEKIQATATLNANNGEELTKHLHSALLSTYNRLGREYNLAGFQGEWLCLESSRPDRIPSIPLCLTNPAV